MLVITSTVSATTNTFGEFESLEVEETLQSTSPTSSPPSFSDSNAMTYTSPTTNFSLNDPHSWPKIISHSIRQSIIAERFDQRLDIDINSKKSARVYDDGRTRYLNSSMFLRKLANCETVKRTGWYTQKPQEKCTVQHANCLPTMKMHSHMDSMIGKIVTVSENTKIPMLIEIMLCPAYLSHQRRIVSIVIWKFNLKTSAVIGEKFLKELLLW